MFVKNLTIRKQEQYEPDSGQFRGVLQLEGTTGKQEITLSAAAISRIFSVISEEVVNRAKSNAAQTKAGMEEAVHEPLLMGQMSQVAGALE